MTEAWPWFVAPVLALVVGVIALAPLGEQVLARGVVFIDLAVAQGAAAAALWIAAWQEHPTIAATQFAAAAGGLATAALVAALVRRRPGEREALIGLLYVAGAALAALGARLDPHGAERLARLLAADLLWADPAQAAGLALAAALSWGCGRATRGRWPDAVFYPVFALAASLAVPVLGLFLVFAGLIVPALWRRAGVGRGAALLIAVAVAAAGLAVSWIADAPSGACVAIALAGCGLASVLAPQPADSPL